MTDERQVSDAIRRGRAQVCASLAELIRIPTVNPPGRHYAEIVDLLEGRCRQLGLATEIGHVPDRTARAVVPDAAEFPRVNLIARWDVGAARTVHFNAHFDVVPADPSRWTSDPFEPRIVGDWLYGRGSGDMKGAIASLLLAIGSLRECGAQPAVNVECSFTCDEETGGQLGAGYVASEGLVNADFVVSCEGGSGLRPGVGHNGVLWFHVTVHGKAAHASMPEKGDNAFERMAEVVRGLQPLKERLAVSDRVFVAPDGAERSPTLNVGGVFHGTDGDKVNTVPGQATFSIDRRIPPNERLGDAEHELREAVHDSGRAAGAPRAEMVRALAIEPCVVGVPDPGVESFARSVRRVRHHPVELSTTSGFTDLHFFVGDGKMSGVGYGPSGERGHGADERVRISDLIQTARVYADFMMRGW